MPLPSTVEGCREVLLKVHASGWVSRLIVRKDFGPRGIPSFPCEGLTLAMDSPEHAALPSVFGRLDSIVRAYGYALYSAKDFRMDIGMFRASFPKLYRFRLEIAPAFSSNFWRRVA
jgi:hypothetical protein